MNVYFYLFFILCFSLEMQSVVKQNLHAESEGDINKLINLKLNASYTYLALVRYCMACSRSIDLQ